MPDNQQVNWDAFDTGRYLAANYETITQADRWLCEALADTWTRISGRLGHDTAAIDIGTGPNLYTIFAALPHVRRVAAYEPATPNLRYLTRQLTRLDRTWTKWIELFSGIGRPYTCGELRRDLSEKLVVRRGSIDDLGPRSAGAVTMFFCAECITADHDAFNAHCRSVVSAVDVGGAIICAFMTGSRGYDTAGVPLPAVPICAGDVRELFTPLVEIERLESVPGGHDVREGHDGMLFLFGWVTQPGAASPGPAR